MPTALTRLRDILVSRDSHGLSSGQPSGQDGEDHVSMNAAQGSREIR